MRIRDIGIRIGRGTPGPFNCITDVDGVRVGHRTVIEKRQRCHSNRRDSHRAASRDGSTRACYAGCHVLNGNGDATGLEWIRESGLLTTPIAFTNTHSVGVVRDALVQAERISADKQQYWCMPVVLETFDGVLNDIWGSTSPLTCLRRTGSSARRSRRRRLRWRWNRHDLPRIQRGIGTSSRKLPDSDGGWTVGALVQANYGRREELRVGGYPVGALLSDVASPFRQRDVGVPGMADRGCDRDGRAFVATSMHADCAPCRRRTRPGRRRHRIRERRHFRCVFGRQSWLAHCRLRTDWHTTIDGSECESRFHDTAFHRCRRCRRGGHPERPACGHRR